jgi:DNA-binding PadR family transcriptional regulator
MARPTLFYALNYVAELIDENLELLAEVARNSDNIDEGEMIDVSDRADESIIAFTDRGIENLQDFLADIRSQVGGIRQFLVDAQCDPEVIERIMAAGPSG